ncbi:MAG: Glutamate-1-semialdehyde 2,1-aminomutase [Burkholderia sp.]|jgi:glutamate-1-semialdehyde 2,1-aminomutase
MDLNDELFARAQVSIPGGVNSPVRAFRAVGSSPRFIDHAKGPYMWDVTGKRFTDYILSWGPMILGHNDERVIRAVNEAVSKGLSFGTVTQGETLIAEEVLKLVPSMEQVRLVSSGTEAGMSAIRLARGYTGRDKIIKFEGCYHGHSDSLLVKAGSGMLTFGNPSSAGVPASFTEQTIVLEYNNPGQLEETFKACGDQIACVIVEAVGGNMNMVRGTPEFLRTMRELCTKYGALLIVDEVMTGFRVALGGAQAYYGITPDITMLGKVIGGGMPVAAFGGRREIMKKIAPEGPVYQAGTLSGNPVAVACGLATLKAIQEPGFHEKLSRAAARLTKGLTAAAKENGITFCADSVGGMFGLYFLPEIPHRYADVMKADKESFNRFFRGMLARGQYFAPSTFEAGFVSIAHTDAVIDETIAAARETFAEMAAER